MVNEYPKYVNKFKHVSEQMHIFIEVVEAE
jgi:hypothetical protein